MKTIVMSLNNVSVLEDIDVIMAEMVEKTPKPADNEKSFDLFLNGNKIKEPSEIASPSFEDVVDAKVFWTTPSRILKPGIFYPSKPTNERYYDFTHSSVGAALIFNQMKIKGESERKGSRKDAIDLKNVLSEIGFDVKVCDDYSVREIRAELDSCNYLMTNRKCFYHFFF